jgi:hypothetical protein
MKKTSKSKSVTQQCGLKMKARIRALEAELDTAQQIFAALNASRNINFHAYEEMAAWLENRKKASK